MIVEIGSVSDKSLNFTYKPAETTAPIIYSLNPASANPGVKGVLEIIGQNFGSEKNQVKVFLSNATGKIYELTVFSVNDTNIKTGLPGGLPGSFIV